MSEQLNDYKDKKIPVILLVGMGHSGSTLTDLIMDSHSQIVGVGELSRYCKAVKYDELCTCGETVTNCSFWQRVFGNIKCLQGLRISRNKFNFIFNRKNNFYTNNQSKRVNIDSYIRCNEEIYKNILVESGKKVVFDSSKDPDRAEALLKNEKLDVTLVHLVRDGRGVAWSYIKTNRPGSRYMKQWAAVNIKTEIIKLRNRDTKKAFIKYEDFASNPQKVISYILSYVGLDFEQKMLSFREKEHHQVGGNYKLRIQKKEDEIKLDEKWKKSLFLKDKIMFNLFFDWLNWYYKIKK